MSGPAVAGFDIGGTNVRGILLDGQRHIIASGRRRRPEDPDALVAAVAEIVDELADDGSAQVAGVGVGCAGKVDRHGVVRSSPNIPTLIEYPLGAELTRRLARPIVVDNDATSATWAEVQTGAARGVANVVFVALGTGIGTGIVLDGELRRGAHGFAGESGHMVVDPDGPRCVCGRPGCWEMFASGSAFGRLARRAASEGRLPNLVAAAGGDVDQVTGEQAAELVREGDAALLELLGEFGWWVGLGIANLVNILDVSTVVIGGGLSDMGTPLVEAIRRGYSQVMPDEQHRPHVAIAIAVHGARAGAIGAALLAAHELTG